MAVTTGPRTRRHVPSLCLRRLSGARPWCSHIRRSEPTLGSRGLPLTPSFHLTPSLVDDVFYIFLGSLPLIPVSEIRPRTPSLRCESDLKLWPPEQLKEDVRLTSRGQLRAPGAPPSVGEEPVPACGIRGPSRPSLSSPQALPACHPRLDLYGPLKPGCLEPPAPHPVCLPHSVLADRLTKRPGLECPPQLCLLGWL